MENIITKIKSRQKNKISHGLAFNIMTILMWVWALSLIFVFVWGIFVSLSDGVYYSVDMSKFLPKKWRFKNYVDAITSLKVGDTKFLGMTFNSIWFSFSFTVIKLGSTVFASYATARYKFKLRRFIYAFIVIQMMIPVYGTTIANYKFLFKFHLIDTPLIMISWAAGHGMNFLILYSFFVNLHSGYEDAGRIDGASEWVICFKLMLPMSVPILVAMGIAMWTGLWNDAQTPLLYLPSYPTLASGMFRYKEVAAFTLDIPTYFAGVLLSAIPPSVIFLIFSDTIMQNLTFGGLKG